MAREELIEGFNVRVYGVLLWNHSVLLVEEVVLGRKLIKFPGGGLETGEAPRDGLKREFLEELGVSIEVGRLVHVSPNYHHSTFGARQLIGLYWEVHLANGTEAQIHSQLANLKIRWQPLRAWDFASELTHPMDHEVAALLKVD